MSLPNAFLLLLFTSMTLLAAPTPQSAAQTPQQAALVLQDAAGSVQTVCVSFSEAEITGLDLLLRAGQDVVTNVQGMGALVCGINDTGCPADDCLCQCKGGGDCVYWSYWRLSDGEWEYAQTGAGRMPVRHGAVQGWVWGPGAVDTAQPPPAVSFAEICTGAGTAVPASTETAVSWLPYALFLGLVLGMGLLILARSNRQRQSS